MQKSVKDYKTEETLAYQKLNVTERSNTDWTPFILKNCEA